ncbi:DNA-dependent protein kinase catalytic subunit-like isoform X3 [Haemaphysalis longicornis]
MSEQIREALSNLHSSKTPDEALTLVEEVDRTCQDQAFSDKDEGYITTLLASDDKGLVAFLKSSVVSDQLKDAKAKGLQVLTGWFEKVPAQLMPHAAAVKDVSSQLVFRDKASKVRCAALGLLSKVLECCQGTHVGDQLDVPSLLHRFFVLLSQPSKLTPTVKVEVLCVLGVIAQHHPAAALPYSDKLLSLYLGELGQLKKAADGKERTTFAGCLQGLAGYLHNFGTSFDEDPDKCFLLFSYVKKALVPSGQATRYDVPRAGLILVSRHASLFGRLLLDEHQPLYRQLCGWSCHGNREMKALGTAALEAFLREVAAALADGEGRDDCLDIFEFFIREFQATLRSGTNTYNLAAALKGYGLLALPCQRYLKEADVLFMLGDVLLRSEHVFQSVSSPAVLEDSLPLLTSFQEALASILRCAHQVPESQLLVVEKLCVLQVEHFPLVAAGLQARYCRSLLLLLLACHPLAPASLAHVVYQGLVRTCSHPIVADVEASEEEEEDGGAAPPGGRLRKITYRHYNFLWGFLLRAVAVKELNDLQVSLEARHAFVGDVYDAMLSAVLSMISKLNLCVKRTNADAETAADMSDPTCGVDAECPKDFNIFINLVDFFRDNFLGGHFEFFPKWAFVLIRKFVEYSTRYPLVSGFYKALAVCFQICDKSSYFDGSPGPGGEEVRRCLCLVSSCVREALGRLQQFRDDLLASCLELVLRAPRSVVRQHAPALVPALQVALGQGLSFLPLARSALDALRLWEQWLAPEVVDACFRQVLPRLCPYLSLGAQAALLASDPAEKTKRPRPRGPRKIPLKLLYQKKVEHSKAHASELESLRRDILAFLGGLAGERRAFLLADLEADTLAAALAWDPETHEHLPFALPFPDAKLDLALDVFLPRVVELARFGGERQTKVAGCELLHALVLYAVGMGVQNTERRAKRPMVHLYGHLFPELLHLACDADQVAQNLFRPLVLQLMHWFSSRSTRGSQESATIVECLWDTVTQPQETTLRDFAAQCLKEFVAWSIRQSSPKELEKSPVNVQSVLRRLCSYCRHPNAFKRVGAALVFNNIYVLLREEEALVDTFILEALAYFVDSLKLAHADERTVGSQELCGRALDNVLRIVSAKSSLLSSPNRKRRWPWDLGSSTGVTLSLAVEWLLTQASCPQSDCRRKCMQLFWSLVPRLPGTPSHAAFVAGLLKANGASFFVDRWEAGVLPAAGGALGSVAAVRHFCDRLLGLVECYAWVLQQRLLEPPLLFQVPGRPSAIFPMVTTFLEQLALCNDVHELVGREDAPLSTPTEQAAFSLVRCSLTVRLFHLLTVWMEAAPESMASVADPFWETEAFWKCCVLCVLLPLEAGYDLADLEVANELPHEMLRFLRQVSCTRPALLLSGLAPALAALVAERPECGLEQVLRLRLDGPELSSQEGGGLLRLTGLVSGYCLLAQLGVVEAGREEWARAPIAAVAHWLAAPAGTPTPLVRELGLRLLQLGTALGAGAAEVLQSLEPTRAWSVMGDQLCQHFVDNGRTFVPALLAMGDRAPATLTQVLSWLLRDRQLASRHGRSLSSALMEQWAVLVRLFEEGSPQAVVNAAVPVLEKLLLLAPEISSAASPHFENLFTLFLKLLQRPGAALVDKALVLGLLPAFARDARPSTCDRLREVLEELVLQHFPPEVSQLAPGDPQLLCYAQAMRRLLAGLEGSGGSPLLLDLVLRVLCRGQGPHFLEPELQRALRRTMPRCSEAKQQELLRTVYQCAANRALSTSSRLGITSRLLPQLVQHASKPAVRQFFVGNIAAIMDTVASKMRAGGSEGELASKILALSCLELLYSCSAREDVSGRQSALNSAFCRARGLASPVGNELTREATRHANLLKKERGELGAGSEAGAALWRRLRCTAYNAIAAIISCTQVEEQFYDVFLFQEKPEKGEFIWNNITDEENVYRFPLEMEAPSRRSRQVVGVAEEAPGEEGSPGRSLASLQGSSLAQEASQYSLSSSMAFWGPGEEQGKAAGPSAESKEEASSTVRRLRVLELEEDELNGHPCMATLCSLLGHMARTHPGTPHQCSAEPGGGGPFQEAGSIAVVPKWLSTITAAMAAEHTRPNALRFLCRAIVNCAEVLKVYRHHLVPVMLAIFSHPQGLVQELDAFAVDLVVTVLTWTADLDAKEGALGVGGPAQRVLEFLVARCGHPRREILRRQLELVNAWVDAWRRELHFPHGIVVQQMEEFELSSKDEKAVLLFGIFVTHDLVTFDTADRSLDRILERLPRLLASKHRVCYTAVADVLGLTLRKMNEGVAGVQASFQGAVEGELAALLRAGQRDQYLLALLHICRLYQPLAARCVESAMLQLPRALAGFRVAILEVVALACGQLEQPLHKLQGLGFLDLLAHGDEATQKASLEICARLPGVATADDWRHLLPSVCRLQGHASGSCRALVYDICMRLYTKHRGDPAAGDVAEQAKRVLLLGLGDTDMPLRLLVSNFWCQESQLPRATRERLVSLLGEAYLPDAEEHFLSSATFLLLELSSHSPDYGRKLFPQPLADCPFVDYAVTGSWRRRHAAMTPLFAETLTLSQTQSSPAGPSGAPSQRLRATQRSLQFTPTQHEGSREAAPYSWLTQSTHPVGAARASDQQQPRPAAQALLQLEASGPAGQQAWSERAQKLQLLRRRFLRDEDQVRQLHMRREVRLQEARKKLEAERHVRREAEVTLYRSYRMGDFPDIEITHAALIAPLQALAQQDQQVAQTLLSAVVASVLRDSQRDPEGASSERLRGGLQGALAAMLEGSVRCFPPLVAFVQEVAFQSATDVRLPVSAISRASISSGHQSLGILLLEEMERAEAASSSAKAPPAKRSKVDGDVPSHTWVHLAELYKSLGDYDAVRASLSLCESLGPEAKQALEHEAQGDYLQARHIYRQLAASSPGDAGGPTWDDAVLECCCLLGEWKELQDEVDARLGGPSALEALWDGAYRQEHYLPLYVKAGTKRTLEEGGAQGCFPAIVRQWMEDSRRKRVLEEECCQELALLCLAQGDACRADYYVRCLTEHFLQDWSSLSVLTPTLIESKLEGLLPLTDLIQYVRQASGCRTASVAAASPERHHGAPPSWCGGDWETGPPSEAVARGSVPEEAAPSGRLLAGWRDRLPSNADSVLLWNEVVANRCFFIKSLGCPVAREKALLLNAFATAMLQQENVPTALRCIAQVEKMRLGRELDEWSHWEYVEAYCALLRKASRNEPLAKQLAAHVRMLEKLEAVAGEGPAPHDPAQSVKYRTLKGQLMSGLSSILGAGAHMTDEQGAAVKLSAGTGRAVSAQSTADEALQQHLAAVAEHAVPPERAAEAHVALALFCGGSLQAAEAGSHCAGGGAASSLSRLGDCPRLMVDSVLTAMRLGHGRAPDMFPRLLQLLQRHPSCSDAFAAQCPRVPCWMFLRWINQVLALLDKQVGPCLFDLVDCVARHYPNALVYPFRVSSSAYTFECPETQSACRAFVGRLQQSMNEVPLVNDFIAALELLQFPDIVFKDWCESVKDALGEKQGPASLRELFKRIGSQLQGWSRDSPGQASASRIHRHFSDTLRKKVTEAFGSQGEKLVGMTPKGFQEQCRQIMRGYKPQAPTVLKDISPWLSRFSSLNQQHSLEIPGQYTGRCRPMPEYHVKIFGFDEAVRVLPSKQRPCRITIRGDNEKEHRFLVKTGEDLRQDDRIERLFEVMNDLLREDPVCRTRHLHLVTYGVVPLTDRVGLIQWLDNTVVLEEFLGRGLSSEELADIQKVEGSYKLQTYEHYMDAYKMPSCQQAATARYHSCLRPSSRQALRQALLGLSSCPEAFFALRSRFVASHAALSIAHWVLGIGDRHLGNFLVDTRSGLEVGIDFGYAFGVATQFLPVPELLPFRLTPQYVALTEPFDQASGPLACAMHYTLHALREGARRLLDMMDVFVQEPTIDWLRFAKRQSLQAKQQKGPGGKVLDWYPRQKVDVVRQKLEGCHPSYIMRDELRLGRGHQQDSLGSMERLCLGAQGPQGAVRRRLAAAHRLSPQQQVECLIEQATDPAILGLTWIGWKPWR